MKVKVFSSASGFYSAALRYESWIDENPDIEVVSTVGDDKTIVITYRETPVIPTHTL